MAQRERIGDVRKALRTCESKLASENLKVADLEDQIARLRESVVELSTRNEGLLDERKRDDAEDARDHGESETTMRQNQLLQIEQERLKGELERVTEERKEALIRNALQENTVTACREGAERSRDQLMVMRQFARATKQSRSFWRVCSIVLLLGMAGTLVLLSLTQWGLFAISGVGILFVRQVHTDRALPDPFDYKFVPATPEEAMSEPSD
jgi:hypothetical protein